MADGEAQHIASDSEEDVGVGAAAAGPEGAIQLAPPALAPGAAPAAAGVAGAQLQPLSPAGTGGTEGDLRALMTLNQTQLQWQMARAEKLDALEAKRQEKEKAESARREEEALQTQMDTVTATLKEQHTREAAQFMVTVAGLTLPAERRTLANAYAEVMRHLETDRDDLEEANRLLRVAVKKVKTLTAEQQEDILDKLKVRKRKNGKQKPL
jgi:hypothetical protein